MKETFEVKCVLHHAHWYSFITVMDVISHVKIYENKQRSCWNCGERQSIIRDCESAGARQNIYDRLAVM